MVRAAVASTGQKGYLHSGGHFVGPDDAWVMPLDQAVQEARRLARATNVVADTVELVDIIGGKIDEASARAADPADDDVFAELAAQLRALPERDLASVLKVLDKDAIKALRMAGIQMKGVLAARPPRHVTGKLS